MTHKWVDCFEYKGMTKASCHDLLLKIQTGQIKQEMSHKTLDPPLMTFEPSGARNDKVICNDKTKCFAVWAIFGLIKYLKGLHNINVSNAPGIA